MFIGTILFVKYYNSNLIVILSNITRKFFYDNKNLLKVHLVYIIIVVFLSDPFVIIYKYSCLINEMSFKPSSIFKYSHSHCRSIEIKYIYMYIKEKRKESNIIYEWSGRTKCNKNTQRMGGCHQNMMQYFRFNFFLYILY